MLATDYEYFAIVIIIIIIMVIYLCIYFNFDVLFLFYFMCDTFYIIAHLLWWGPGGCDGGTASDDGCSDGGTGDRCSNL